MSRRTNRKRRDNPYNNNIANRRLPLSKSPTFLKQPSFFSLFEDRRQFHPERIYRPARAFNQNNHTLVVPKPSKTHQKPNKLKKLLHNVTASVGFENPKSVLVCVRRNIRKEVLHAINKAGRVGQKRPKRNWLSSIKCRR